MISSDGLNRFQNFRCNWMNGGRCFSGHPSVMNTRDCFEKSYKIRHVLGKGGFGIVYAGIRNADGLDVAVKHIAKAKIKDWGQVSHISQF